MGNLQELAFREKKKSSEKSATILAIGSGAEGGNLLLAVDVLCVTLPAVTCGMEECMGWYGRARCPAAIP